MCVAYDIFVYVFSFQVLYNESVGAFLPEVKADELE